MVMSRSTVISMVMSMMISMLMCISLSMVISMAMSMTMSDNDIYCDYIWQDGLSLKEQAKVEYNDVRVDYGV